MALHCYHHFNTVVSFLNTSLHTRASCLTIDQFTFLRSCFNSFHSWIIQKSLPLSEIKHTLLQAKNRLFQLFWLHRKKDAKYCKMVHNMKHSITFTIWCAAEVNHINLLKQNNKLVNCLIYTSLRKKDGLL